MKKYALLLWTATIFFPLFAQQELDHIHTKSHVCELPPSPYEGHVYVPPQFLDGEETRSNPATININYLTSGTVFGYNCTTWPVNAQTAMDYAASIWAASISSNQSININVCWSQDMGGNTLGSAGAVNYYYLTSGGVSSWYPVALVEHLVDDGNLQPVEIQAVFNANQSDWYFGIDGNVPWNKIDFVTTALHEIGHGLGFSGGSDVDDGNGANGTECNGTNGHGCYGFNTGTWNPDIYTRQISQFNGAALVDETNPSTTVGDLLLGQSGGLFAYSSNVVSSNGSPAKMYTPSSYQSGSSYSHWDQATFPTELMRPILSYGQAIHNPGLSLSMLADIGWPVSGLIFPVEWARFEAHKHYDIVLLEWETASEVNNAGFEVQRSQDGVNWEALHFVPGVNRASVYHYHDHYPYSGINYYRLVQTDYDGSSDISKVNAVYFDTETVEIGLMPNPTQDVLIVGYPGMDATRALPMVIHSAQGQTVMQSQLTQSRQEVDVRSLPAGIYWLQIEGAKPVSFMKK